MTTSFVISAVNAVIKALGSAITGLLSILPNMPDLPDLPQPFLTAEAWVAWFFPVSTVVDVLSFCATVWLVWQLASIALRWAKAIK